MPPRPGPNVLTPHERLKWGYDPDTGEDLLLPPAPAQLPPGQPEAGMEREAQRIPVAPMPTQEQPPQEPKQPQKPKGGGYGSRISSGLAGIAKQFGNEGYYNKLQERQNKLADIQATEDLAKWTRGLKHESEMQQIEQQQLDLQRKATAQTEEKLQAVQAAVDRYRSAEVDPGRLMRNHTGMAALAIALGAVGQYFAQRGGQRDAPNLGVRAIQRAIARDIDAQKAEIDKLGNEVSFANNDLQLTMQLFDREEDQVAAARIMAIERYQRALNHIAQQWAGEKAMIQNQMVQEQLEHQKQMEKKNFALKLHKAHLDEQRMKQGWAKLAMAKQAMQQKAGDRQVLLPPGMAIADPRAAPPNDKDLEKAKEMAAAYRNVKSLLGEVLAMRRKHGATLDFGVRAQLETLINRAKSGMRIVDESGARLEESELEMMGIDFHAGNLGMITERLETLLSSIDDKINSALYTRNIKLESGPSPTEGMQLGEPID